MIKVAHRGCVVEWNGNFRFGGDPEGALDVYNAVPAQALGAAFLSGCISCRVVYVDEEGEERYFATHGANVVRREKDWKGHERWSLCGPGVADGRIVADQCFKRKGGTMSVCPVVEELSAFGYLVGCLYARGLAKPRMTRFCEPTGELEGEDCLFYTKEYDGDGYGKMAHLVQSGVPVLNQMMSTICRPVFYGRVISVRKWWGKPVFMMRRQIAKHYFPTESILLRDFAAAWVPVSLRNTSAFSNESGYGGELVDVFVPSEMTPGLGSFLRFLEAIGGMHFAASSDPKLVPVEKGIPLFRSLAAYNIGKEKFREVVF